MPTKTLDFQFLTNDLAFKTVFSNPVILNDFMKSFQKYLNISPNLKFSSVLSEKYIAPQNKKYKSFYSDIVGTISSGNIIFLEMYRNDFNLRNYKKSLSYLCRLYSNQIKKGDYKYERMNKVIGINLIKGNFYDNEKVVNEYNSECRQTHTFKNVWVFF